MAIKKFSLVSRPWAFILPYCEEYNLTDTFKTNLIEKLDFLTSVSPPGSACRQSTSTSASNTKCQTRKKIVISLSREILATGMAHAPATSFASCESLFSAAIAALLDDFGFVASDMDEKIARSCVPSQTVMSTMIEELAAKKFWSFKDNRVKKTLLDIDAALGTSKACASAMDHSQF